MRHIGRGVLTVALLCGCTRHSLVQEFERPAVRLRSAVHPATVAIQDASDARTLRMVVGIFAPYDSAVLVVLREDVPLERVRDLIGEERVQQVVAEWQRRGLGPNAPALVSFNPPDRIVPNVSVRVDSASWPAPANWFVRQTFDHREKVGLDTTVPFLIVRPGDQVRLKTAVKLDPAAFSESGNYALHFEWIAIPSSRADAFSCGGDPLFVRERPRKMICGEDPSGYAVVRTLDAHSRMVSTNYWAASLTAAVIGVVVAVIGRS